MGGAKVLFAFCLVWYFVFKIDGSFIKPNNVPRVGRSNEADGPYDQSAVGYVIKTIPIKNIPRMGRRNGDAENRFDIPKFYQLPAEIASPYEDDGQIEAFYGSNQFQNMKR